MCNAALEYAKRGWKVFPALIEENKKKSYKSAVHSNGERWGATTDPDEIRHDFAKWHAELIGIPTGPEQGFFVVEADTPEGHDVDGIASLRALEAEHGPLPDTLMAKSPTGSLHHYFKWPSEGTIRNSTSRIGPGIDVRGQGGMVLGPPSVRSGVGAYRWLNGNTIADAPPWLIALATADDDDGPRTPGEKPEADPELIYLAMTVIPNNDVSHDDFNRTGMAIWRATGGHPRGLEAFAMWAQKSKKCRSKSRQGGFIERWNHYFKSPPTVIGAGSILKWANEASPGWDREYLRKLEDGLFTPNDEATERKQAEWLEKNVWNKKPNAKANMAKKSKASAKAKEPEPNRQTAETNSGLAIVRVADVEGKKVDWLWPGRIARGKLTIVAGMPDVNKSTMTLDLTARVTTGAQLPASEGRVPLGSVVILTAEDDVADTVRPRLEVAGADLARVHVIASIKAANGAGPRSFDLSQDIGRLEKAIGEIGDVLLVIIDPISAYMGKPGKLDSYRSTDVRATLAPLQEMAARCGVAVVGIDHLNKSGGAQAMMRVLGSVAFVAAARAVYVVVRDEDDGERRLMLPAKNNLGKIRTGLAFRVFEKLATTVFDAYPAIKWEDEPVTMTADEALANKQDGRKSETAEAAKALIAEMLAEKPKPQKEIEQRAETQQISHRSLTTAKKAMGVVSTKVSTAWWWSLPGKERPI